VAITTYGFALVHLTITLLTAFPLGPFKQIPLQVHGQYEFIISGLLIILIWPLGIESDLIKRNFYIFMGFALLVLWLLTNYQNIAYSDVEG
jgi:hypothetical protein